MNNWAERMTNDELNAVELIITKMDCNPRPTVNHFLNTLSNALDAGILKNSEVAV